MTSGLGEGIDKALKDMERAEKEGQDEEDQEIQQTFKTLNGRQSTRQDKIFSRLVFS